MSVFMQIPDAAPSNERASRRQSADRTPSRQQSISSMHSATSSNRRASVGYQTHPHIHDHEELGPRPVRTPLLAGPKRVGVPKAAYEQPKPSNISASVPGKRTVGDAVKDGCAYVGLGCAAIDSAAVTYPISGACCLGCGLLGCLGACLCTRKEGGRRKATYNGGNLGVKLGGIVSTFTCVPCIGGPSVRRLEESGKLDRDGTRKTLKRLMPHFRGESGSKALDDTLSKWPQATQSQS